MHDLVSKNHYFSYKKADIIRMEIILTNVLSTEKIFTQCCVNIAAARCKYLHSTKNANKVEENRFLCLKITLQLP